MAPILLYTFRRAAFPQEKHTTQARSHLNMSGTFHHAATSKATSVETAFGPAPRHLARSSFSKESIALAVVGRGDLAT